MAEEPHILGTWTRRPAVSRSELLLGVRGLPVLLALHEFLVERHAFLAERTVLGRIRRKISADQAEDLLAPHLRLLGASPQRPNPDDLAPEIFDQLREQTDGGAGAHQILDDEHLGALTDQP